MRLRMPTNLRRGLASYLRTLPNQLHSELRAELMVEAYRSRREHYRGVAVARQLAYMHDRVKERSAKHLAARGISVRPRPLAAPVHTLAFLPMISWHRQLVPPLAALGSLSQFDYEAHGLSYQAITRRDPDALNARRHACAEFEKYAANVSRYQSVDWIFVYANGLEILRPTIDRVREITGAPVVSMCLDDKQSWTDDAWGEQRGGQIDIAPAIDLAWTSSRVACEWYMVEGSNPIFLGEGCSPEIFVQGKDEKSIDVCFVGQAYGFRRAFVERLRRTGIKVQTAGAGWSDGSVTEARMVELLAQSKVILGLGGIGWSQGLKNVKGRDFDSPCVGAYLTSYNPDLTEFFDLGREIACFSTHDEAVDQIRELLQNDDKRRGLAVRGRERCLRDHSWRTRFSTVLRALGIFDE